MRAALSLARMELRRNFRSPVGFAVAGLFLLVHGIYFVSLLENYSGASLMAMSASQSPMRLNLVDAVLQPLASGDTFLLLLLLPGLTMRLLSEEWRSGTSEILMSYPLREVEIVMGKFLAAAAMLGGLLFLGLLAPLCTSFFGGVELPTVLSQLCGASPLRALQSGPRNSLLGPHRESGPRLRRHGRRFVQLVVLGLVEPESRRILGRRHRMALSRLPFQPHQLRPNSSERPRLFRRCGGLLSLSRHGSLELTALGGVRVNRWMNPRR